MKPVDQTVFGEPNGNCFAACVASILEIPLKGLPNFNGSEYGPDITAETQVNALRLFLAKFKLSAIRLVFGDNDVGNIGFTIAGGPAARGLNHCCIYKDGKLAHDPHPDRTGLTEVEDHILFYTPNPKLTLYQKEKYKAIKNNTKTENQ